MKLILTNQTGGYDVTQQVQKVTLSGDYQQCARNLGVSMLIQSASEPTGGTIPTTKPGNPGVPKRGSRGAVSRKPAVVFREY